MFFSLWGNENVSHFLCSSWSSRASTQSVVRTLSNKELITHFWRLSSCRSLHSGDFWSMPLWSMPLSDEIQKLYCGWHFVTRKPLMVFLWSLKQQSKTNPKHAEEAVDKQLARELGYSLCCWQVVRSNVFERKITYENTFVKASTLWQKILYSLSHITPATVRVQISLQLTW